jgi:hypothetical protein
VEPLTETDKLQLAFEDHEKMIRLYKQLFFRTELKVRCRSQPLCFSRRVTRRPFFVRRRAPTNISSFYTAAGSWICVILMRDYTCEWPEGPQFKTAPIFSLFFDFKKV